MKRKIMCLLALLCCLLLAAPALGETNAYVGDWEMTGVYILGVYFESDEFSELTGTDFKVYIQIKENGEINISSEGMDGVEDSTGAWTADENGMLYLDGVPAPFLSVDPETDTLVLELNDTELDGALVFEKKQPAPTAAPTAQPTAEPTAEPTPAPTAAPETPSPEKARYSFSGVSYTGKAVQGSLIQEGSAKAKGLHVRVTFYIAGNYYMGTVGEVDSQGYFEVDGVGPIQYITVVAVEEGSGAVLDAEEIFVTE